MKKKQAKGRKTKEKLNRDRCPLFEFRANYVSTDEISENRTIGS